MLELARAREAIGVSERARTQARENLELAEGRYEAGVGNVIELVDAQVQRASAEAEYVRSLYALPDGGGRARARDRAGGGAAVSAGSGGSSGWRRSRPRSLALACGGGEEGSERYLTELVDRGEIAATVTATGTVQPVTKVQVGTYVSGPIREIYVDFNSPVSKDQLVAKIDPAPFEVKVRQAEANLANARAQVEKARADLRLKRLTVERNRSLRGRDLISQDELDTSESNDAQAVAQLALEEAGVKQAAGGARGGPHQPRLHRDPLAGRRRRRLAQRRRRPDRRGELPDPDALRDRAGPHQDAGERQRERVGHRRPARRPDGELRRRRLPRPRLRGPRRAGAQRPDHGAERGDLRRHHRGRQRATSPSSRA